MPPLSNPMPRFPESFEFVPGTPPGQEIAAQGNRPDLQIRDVPAEIVVYEDTPTAIDLSEIKWQPRGNGNAEITVEFTATSGTFTGSSTSGVEVVGSGTGAMLLIGRPSEIRKFLKDAQAIEYTGASNDFGTLDLDISIVGEDETTEIATTTLVIEEVPDQQIGTPQDDVLTGDAGRDILIGLESDDLLTGHGGNDTIQGDAGRDTIIGGDGADHLDGGADDDVLQYIGSDAGIHIDLNLGADGFQQASGGHAEGDVIQNFEHVYGTDFSDQIIGDAGRNILFGYGGDDIISGGAGDDVIRGGTGADTMDGGEGYDWLRYLESDAGVNVDLSLALQTSAGDADGDVISGFENIQGSDHGDTLTGDANDNYLIGFEGDDVISAGAGRDTVRGGEGADTLDGGEGIDTLQYLDSNGGIVVDLNADIDGFQSASGGSAEGDVISNFENILATDFDDVLLGNSGRNILYGYDGDDILNGGAGKDALLGGAGADEFIFDTELAASNVDRLLDFETGVDMLMLASGVFTGLAVGALAADAFHVSVAGIAETLDHRIVFDDSNGDLYFDADGSGAGEAVLFARLTFSQPDIDASDIFIF